MELRQQSGAYSTNNNYPGEGMLVYPGYQVGIAGVAPSMRLKWMRDGVDDYEYVQMLRNAGEGTWALGLSSSVGPDWTNWTRDINALANVRYQLGVEPDQPTVAPLRRPQSTITQPAATQPSQPRCRSRLHPKSRLSLREWFRSTTAEPA